MIARLVLLLAVSAVHALVPSDVSQRPLLLPKSNIDRLTFDDIFLPSTNSTLPTLNKIYHNLDFRSFSLFNTSSPSSASPVLDIDCAISGTNAIVASRQPEQAWPRFLLDPRVAREKGIAPFFNLLGFAQKPIGFVKAGTRVWVHALGVIDHDGDAAAYSLYTIPQSLPHKLPISHTHDRDWGSGRYEIISSYIIVIMVLGDGYTDNFYLNFTELFPGWGESVNMVEMFAEAPTGEDEDGLYTGFEDWMFCIDDLVVEWLDINDEKVVEEVHGNYVLSLEKGSMEMRESRFMHVEVNLRGGGIVTKP